MTAPCRICRTPLSGPPLLEYAAMPAWSQHLSDRPDNNSGVELRLFECPACGVLQLAGAPVPYYREVIRAVGVSGEMRQWRRRQFGDWLKRHGLNGRGTVLECGCGGGEYLELMRAAGANVRGMEFSDANVAAAAAAGLRVEKVFFDSAAERLGDAPFDGFYILNYLEHLPDIPTYLRGLRANLSPGAAGLVEVPNFDMMVRERLFAEFTIDHLYYFTAASLRRVLEMNGFDVTACSVVWHDYIISAEVRLRTPFDPAPFRRAETGLRAGLKAWIDSFGRGELAVWGAGHQSFAVLAWSGFRDHVAFVVDSAPFKQGRYTPASGLPIVAPEALYDSDIKAVLIMAGAYSGEIAARIRSAAGDRFKLAVLQGNRILEV